MPKQDPAKLKKVSVNLPFGIGGAEWEADITERKAAWSLYIELVTRITVQSLEADQGLLREALNSLHSMFAITRQILREAGSEVGISLNLLAVLLLPSSTKDCALFSPNGIPYYKPGKPRNLPLPAPKTMKKNGL